MRAWQVNHFAMVSPLFILCIIPGLTKSSNIGLELSIEGLQIFSRLEQGIAGFIQVDRLSCKKKELN
jgi:hypothetical protein